MLGQGRKQKARRHTVNRIATLTLGSLLLLGSAGCAQNPRPYTGPYYGAQGHPAQAAPPPPPAYQARRELRSFDRGFREGYRAGYEHRGGSGAPGYLTDGMWRDDKREFRRGYHDGFDKGKWDRRQGFAPAY
jgi:hypothetical protein